MTSANDVGPATGDVEDQAGVRVLPTSARGQRTRAAILAAARRIFETRGFADTNVAAITTEAGVGYGSFYVYFSSKEEIFAEVARQMQEDIYVRSRAPAASHDVRERLDEENRLFFELYRENARMIQLVEEVARIDDDFRRVLQEQRQEYVGRTARALVRLQKAGRMDASLDAIYTAHALGAMVERLAYLCSQDDSIDPELSRRTLSQLWIKIVGLEE